MFLPVNMVTEMFMVTDAGTLKASAEADKWQLAMTFFVKLVSHDGHTRESKQSMRMALAGAHVADDPKKSSWDML
mgnify:CR=1 FL=1